jgi:phosphoserine aminotransferase
MGRIYNFSAGPATLPLEVLEKARDEFLDYNGSGMSIIEMSHRGKVFDAVHEKSFELLRKIANIPDRFDINYMTGGASTQFALIPLNLSGKGRKAGYVNTGSWSKKAIEQAKIQDVDLQEIASSKDSNFNHIPDPINVPGGLDYVHLTSNNTIFGTQYKSFPDPAGSVLTIDMSSDFLSKPINWDGIGIAYAGLQKNAGPSGLTVAIVDRELYKRESDRTPTMFRYSTYGESKSVYNTPPTFQIYMLGLILEWIESKGGLTAIQQHNETKASLIYEVMDANPEFYIGHSKRDSRSLMNVTFNCKSDDLNAKFLEESKKHNMDGLKGHRSVGGLRASIYNAMTKEGCQALADFMKDFLQRNG